jgi:hypothetical protein
MIGFTRTDSYRHNLLDLLHLQPSSIEDKKPLSKINSPKKIAAFAGIQKI